MSYEPGRMNLLPEVVKMLLIINGLLFGAVLVFGEGLYDILGLHLWLADKFQPFQVVTHMFMHGGMAHLLFNMFALWMFGAVIENLWGPKRFFIYYLLTGFGAAFLHYMVVYWQIYPNLEVIDTFLDTPTIENLKAFVHTHTQNSLPRAPYEAMKYLVENNKELAINPSDSGALQNAILHANDYRAAYLNALPPVVGASGAVFGLLLAFGMMFPNEKVYIYFLFPMKAKYFVILYGALELFLGIQNSAGDNIAHFAHLGGMIFGFLLIKYWGYSKIR